MTIYYFAIASQRFLLLEEPIEEILRERTSYYYNNNKKIDFWLVKNPRFLNNIEMLELKQRLTIPTIAIISTNVLFIKWIKLRLGFVLTGRFKQDRLSYKNECLTE